MGRFMFLRMVTLMCAVAAATAAYAQGPDQVLIEIQNVPPGGVREIFVAGATADHTIVGASSGSIASNAMSEGKSADIAIDRCGDQVWVSVIQDGDLPLPERENCDRTIEENWPWGGGRRLVIDGRRGVVVPVPVGTVSRPVATTGRATTIGSRADVQAAAGAVLDALLAEPPAGVATGATRVAVMQLATMSDTALGTWIPSFRDNFAAMGRQGASNTTLASMEQLLTVVAPHYANYTSSLSAPIASPAPPGVPGERPFRIDLSSEYSTQLPGVTGSPISLSGRVRELDGSDKVPDAQWYYSFAGAGPIGYSGADGKGSPSLLLADPTSNRFVQMQDFTVILGGRAPADLPTWLGAVPDQIIKNVWPLMPLFERSIARALGARSRPAIFSYQLNPFAGSRVDQRGQNQGDETPASAQGQRTLDARPPQLLLAARSFFETIGRMFVPAFTSSASSAPGVRLHIGPGGRREYWIDPMQSAAGRAQSTTESPRPSLKVFIRSLGRSTGTDAQQAILINDGNVPIRVLEGESFATEPLEGVSEQSFARELEKYAGRPRMTMNLTSYCLNYEKAAPTKGQIFRLAPRAAQDQFGPVRRVLQAAARVRDRGELNPDGDPNLYFHSVRQWAIWTVEQRFNERTFADALLEYTKKNVTAAGRRWTKEIETAARSIIPNRWRDVQRVLAEARG
jgi:hypothetical protein